jgi:hypothetical protein
MQDAFAWVMFAVVGVAFVLGLVAFAQRNQVFDEIGRGGIGDEREAGPPELVRGAAVAARERDEEVRQMLEAKSARRQAKGLPPLDVEAELAQLTRPRADPALEREVRELVEARNLRRARRGQEPLDVEAEVARQLATLTEGPAG